MWNLPTRGTTMAHRRLITAVVPVAVVAIAVSGCAAIPESSPVEVVGPRVSETTEVPVAPPPDDLDPLSVVRGFVEASASQTNRHAAARAYLTDEAKAAWNDPAVVVVLDDTFNTVYATGAGDAQGDDFRQVLLRGQQLGQVGGVLRSSWKQIERQEAHGRQRVLRALRLRLEPADRLDRVTEEVEPHRRLLAGREEIEDAAAHREVADLIDEIGTAEPVARQMGHELVHRVVLAGLDLAHRVGEVGGPRQTAEQGARRRHHGGGRAAAGAVEGHRLLRPHHQRDLGLLIGGERGDREVDDPFFPGEQARGLDPGQGVGFARDDHQQRPAEIAGQQVADPGRGRHG